jgi:RNA polymerase sigma-70 factor (ECF subfamily)
VNPNGDRNVSVKEQREQPVPTATAILATPLPAVLGRTTAPGKQKVNDSAHEQVDGTVLEEGVTDEKLFELANKGDRDALGTLIRRYEKPLFGLLARMTQGDHHRADDLFQDTFLHAMKAGATFNSQRKFKPWVTAIAVNLVRDDARKRRLRGETTLDGVAPDGDRPRHPEPVSAGATPLEAAERLDDENDVNKAVRRLTDLEREVVLLHFFNGLTLLECSEILKIPLGTAKSRLHAALTRLSGMLRKKSV